MQSHSNASPYEWGTRNMSEIMPVHIIDILPVYGQNRKSKYVLRANELNKLLAPIRDIEVALIAIVGHSRRGKSFILNYMCRYLSDPNNPEWMGKGTEKLEGFKWLAAIEPQTDGLWVSKPFILKQSNGKELAVILMDTQGLFDDQSDQRDWSTIVGLSLLISSCLIVNVFNDISDDILTTLNDCINYGLQAVEANNGEKKSIPFQNLLFLIRDWTNPQIHKHGFSGGNQYLKEKLVVRPNQATQAQNVRKNINNCFEDISCYLMPTFGDVVERKDFDGSHIQLKAIFKDKMEEFIKTFLKPDELVPKMSDGYPITGKELEQQIRTFVEVFNREEMPEPKDIVEAKAKLMADILMRKLEESYCSQMQEFIESKPFVSRKVLSEKHKSMKSDAIDTFQSNMKVDNPDLSERLWNNIDERYQIIYEKNENRRQKSLEDCVKGLTNNYKSVLNKKLNQYLEPELLEEVLNSERKNVFDRLGQFFGDEDKSLFTEQKLNLTEIIHDIEAQSKKINFEKKKIQLSSMDGYLNNIVELYTKNMDQLLNDNIYLTNEEFKESELRIRAETKTKFMSECGFGSDSANEMFFLKIDPKLKEIKNVFKQKYLENCEKVFVSTKEIFDKSIDKYKREMTEKKDLMKTMEDLDVCHSLAERKARQIFDTCPFKEDFFIKDFADAFDYQMSGLYENFKTVLSEKNERMRNKYQGPVQKALDHYKKEMNDSMKEKKFNKIDEINRFHAKHRNSAIKIYDNSFDDNKHFDPLFMGFQSELFKRLEAEFEKIIEKYEEIQKSDETVIELLVNECKNTFSTKMDEIVDNVNNEVQLSQQYLALKDRLKGQFLGTTVNDSSLLSDSLQKFENYLDLSFNGFKLKLENKKTLVLNEYQNLVVQKKNDYKQTIDQLVERSEFVTDEELQDLSQRTKTQIISDLKNQLKPFLDIKIETFIDQINQFIDNELRQYLQDINRKRNIKWDSIIQLSKQYITQYKTKINETFDSIQSEEELQTKHNSIVDKILKNCRKSKDFPNEELITNQIQYIGKELNILIKDFSAELENRIRVSDQKYQSFYDNSKDFYEKQINSMFKNSRVFTDEDLQDLLIRAKTSTVDNFENQIRKAENSLKIMTQIRDHYMEELNDFIDGSVDVLNERNDDNRKLLTEELGEREGLIKQKYFLQMKKAINSIPDENDLETKHNQLVNQLLIELNDEINPMNIPFVETTQIRFQKYATDELAKLRLEFLRNYHQKSQNIRTVAEGLLSNYSKALDEKMDEMNTEAQFNKLNKEESEKVVKLFEHHIRANPSSESLSLLDDFRKTIENYSKTKLNDFRQRNASKAQNTEILINEISKQLDDQLKKDLGQFKDVKQLRDGYKKHSEKLRNTFIEKSGFKQSKQILDPYLKKLDKNFSEILKDQELFLDMKLLKDKSINQRLRQELRRFYREQMDVFLKGKLFVTGDVLKKNHDQFVQNTICRYKNEKGTLNDKEFVRFVEEIVEDIRKKYEEDNDLKRPTESQAIGIDLGTTNSCVAYFKYDSSNPNNVVVIPNELGNYTTPSVVSFRDKNEIIVGNVAKDDIHAYPRNTIVSAKRLIGRQFKDRNVQNNLKVWHYKVQDLGLNGPKICVKVDETDKTFFPEEVSAEVLKKMKESAESHLNCEVAKAVITVPAYFNDAQREATKDAGKLAGLEVLRIINEPTAAAIAFKVDRNEETETRRVLIYDFGGGTFDVSVLEISRGTIKVLATGGDNHLGGDDIDTNLINHCLQHFEKEFKVKVEGVEGVSAMCRLRNACEEHKKRLSSAKSTTIVIPDLYQKHDLRVEVTRDQFEGLNNNLFVKSIDLVKETLKESKLKSTEMDDIVLVGGTTRIPRLRKLLQDFFGGHALNKTIDPDEAVAKGAAIQAALLNGKQSQGLLDVELLDVCSHSLGVEIIGGIMSVIIPRNTPVPTTLSKEYYTVSDNQTSINIKVFEGENKMTADNHLLGEFVIEGIPPNRRGREQVIETFNLTEEGILHVKAKIKSTGGENEIEITENKGRLTQKMMDDIMNEKA